MVIGSDHDLAGQHVLGPHGVEQLQGDLAFGDRRRHDAADPCLAFGAAGSVSVAGSHQRDACRGGPAVGYRLGADRVAIRRVAAVAQLAGGNAQSGSGSGHGARPRARLGYPGARKALGDTCRVLSLPCSAGGVVGEKRGHPAGDGGVDSSREAGRQHRGASPPPAATGRVGRPVGWVSGSSNREKSISHTRGASSNQALITKDLYIGLRFLISRQCWTKLFLAMRPHQHRWQFAGIFPAVFRRFQEFLKVMRFCKPLKINVPAGNRTRIKGLGNLYSIR